MTYIQLNELPDETVIACLKDGQGDALAVLFRRYQRLVFSVAMKVLRDLGEAEDMTQTVFMTLYRQASLYDAARGTPTAWILKTAYHLSLNRRRHLKVRSFYSSQEISEIEELLPLFDPGDMSYLEKRRLVEQGLETLNATQRKVLELALFEGLTMAEISQKTGVSLGNVRHVYYRSIDRLRARMAAEPGTELKAVRKEVSRAEA